MIVAHVLPLQSCGSCVSQLSMTFTLNNNCLCTLRLIRIPAAHESRHKRCWFNSRVCRNRQTVGKSQFGTATMQASARLLMQQLQYHCPLRASIGLSEDFCFLHSAPTMPLWQQTLALKCFNHINLGHCQLHLSHPTQCFNISHLNIFSGRTQAG